MPDGVDLSVAAVLVFARMSSDRNDASAKAELSALVDAVESCRSRLTALAERRNAASRGKDDEADSLLVAIYVMPELFGPVWREVNSWLRMPV